MAELNITSPKRGSAGIYGWEHHFPYYAGYSVDFAKSIISSAGLGRTATILDPWNGSGTTTFAAASLGFGSIGLDINPAMILVAKARLATPIEADSLEPLGREVLKMARRRKSVDVSDPLRHWFGPITASSFRSIEQAIREKLIGKLGRHDIASISGVAATLYVALFAVCRSSAQKFQSSNPTWLRKPQHGERKALVNFDDLGNRFASKLGQMASALSEVQYSGARTVLRPGNSVTMQLARESVDMVFTSPPYCTRIDYAAATRLELAILYPLLCVNELELRREMLGSTRVPNTKIQPSHLWGETCNRFLVAVREHPSRASSTYYYQTHLDYFHKLSCSLNRLSECLKPSGQAVFVIQDSFYKDLHNDVPRILSEMARRNMLRLVQQKDFRVKRSMSSLNRHSRAYCGPRAPTEAVLCFIKH